MAPDGVVREGARGQDAFAPVAQRLFRQRGRGVMKIEPYLKPGCVKKTSTYFCCPYSRKTANQCPFREKGLIVWCKKFLYTPVFGALCANEKAWDAMEGGRSDG